jgi:hypothetical protein
MPSLICGPIVGLVGSDRANILLEFDAPISNLRIQISDLGEDSAGVSINDSLNFDALRPRAHVITGLRPATRYSFEIVDERVDNIGSVIVANFKTQSADTRELQVIGLSGWSEREATRISESARSANIIVHCGNLVPTFTLFASLANREAAPSSSEIDLALRAHYRATLTGAGLRELLSQNSNIAIWGEEESLSWDGAGKICYRMPSAWRIAHQVYRDYLRALYDCDDRVFMRESVTRRGALINKMCYPHRPSETYTVTIGKSVIVMLDLHSNQLVRRNGNGEEGSLPDLILDRSRPILGNSERRELKRLQMRSELNYIFATDMPFVSTPAMAQDGSDSGAVQNDSLFEIFMYAYAMRLQKQCNVVLLTGRENCSSISTIARNKFYIRQISVGRLDKPNATGITSSEFNHKNWHIEHKNVCSTVWAHVEFVISNASILAFCNLIGQPTSEGRVQTIPVPHIAHDPDEEELIPVPPVPELAMAESVAPRQVSPSPVAAPVPEAIVAPLQTISRSVTAPVMEPVPAPTPAPVKTVEAVTQSSDATKTEEEREIEREFQSIMSELRERGDVEVDLEGSSPVSQFDMDAASQTSTAIPAQPAPLSKPVAPIQESVNPPPVTQSGAASRPSLYLA